MFKRRYMSVCHFDLIGVVSMGGSSGGPVGGGGAVSHMVAESFLVCRKVVSPRSWGYDKDKSHRENCITGIICVTDQLILDVIQFIVQYLLKLLCSFIKNINTDFETGVAYTNPLFV